jgi:hypothetical protein
MKGVMRRLLTACIVLGVLCGTRPAFAQRTTTPARDTTTAVDTTKKVISPGSAFFRSVLIPGWGQLSVGSKTRAAVFITLQSASWYMLVKTLKKLSQAEDRRDARVTQWTPIVTDTLLAMADPGRVPPDTALQRRVSDPDTLKFLVRSALDTTTAVRAANSLVNSRQEQRQDWITYTLFLTLASGVDAFVAAHLADFPATIEPRRNGAFQLKFTLPAQRRP